MEMNEKDHRVLWLMKMQKDRSQRSSYLELKTTHVQAGCVWHMVGADLAQNNIASDTSPVLEINFGSSITGGKF